jgi:hypothetical protein
MEVSRADGIYKNGTIKEKVKLKKITLIHKHS